MNVSQYKQAIKICREANLPLMAWGPGGVGKTRGSEQAAEELGIQHINIQGPLLQPVDLLGLPERQNNKTIWLRPSILPEDGEGIINIDELPDSVLTMQKAYYQLILDHKVQTHILPKTWYVMGAGNRPEDKGLSSNMPAPLITRFVHCGVCCNTPDFTEQTPTSADVDIDDFINYAIDSFHHLVIAFLKFRPEFIYKNQATPRTWEYTSFLLNTTFSKSDLVLKELIKGTIGSAIGIEFNAFVDLALKLPSLKAIANSPDTSPIPQEPSTLYAVTTGLLQMMQDKSLQEGIMKYIKRIGREFQFFFFTQARNKYKEIIANKIYIDWANKNTEYLV